MTQRRAAGPDSLDDHHGIRAPRPDRWAFHGLDRPSVAPQGTSTCTSDAPAPSRSYGGLSRPPRPAKVLRSRRPPRPRAPRPPRRQARVRPLVVGSTASGDRRPGLDLAGSTTARPSEARRPRPRRPPDWLSCPPLAPLSCRLPPAAPRRPPTPTGGQPGDRRASGPVVARQRPIPPTGGLGCSTAARSTTGSGAGLRVSGLVDPLGRPPGEGGDLR